MGFQASTKQNEKKQAISKSIGQDEMIFKSTEKYKNNLELIHFDENQKRKRMHFVNKIK